MNTEQERAAIEADRKRRMPSDEEIANWVYLGQSLVDPNDVLTEMDFVKLIRAALSRYGSSQPATSEARLDLVARLRALARYQHDDMSVADEAADALISGQLAASVEPVAWVMTQQQVIALAEELIVGATTVGGADDDGNEGDVRLMIRMSGTVADDDGNLNSTPVLAFCLDDYPDEGVYPIDPADPKNGLRDQTRVAAQAQPSVNDDDLDRVARIIDQYDASEIGLWGVVEEIMDAFGARFYPTAQAQPSARDREDVLIRLLAPDHKGMRVDYHGLLKQAQDALAHGIKETGLAEMLRQLEGHLTELGRRWYADDTAVVDEILQLYCIESDTRAAIDAARAAKEPCLSCGGSGWIGGPSYYEPGEGGRP